MRHKIAMHLFKLARRITILAHKVDDDLTGKFIYLPAIPEYEVSIDRVEVLRRNEFRPDKWIIRSCKFNYYGEYSYQTLKEGEVDLNVK